MKAVRLDNIIHFSPVRIDFYTDKDGHPACDLVTRVENKTEIAASICAEFHEQLRDIYVGDDFGDFAASVFANEVNTTHCGEAATVTYATVTYEQRVINLNAEFNHAISKYLKKKHNEI